MAERLGRLARDADPQRNVYLSQERANELETLLATARNPGQPAIELRLRLGLEQLAAGDIEPAVETLTGALEAQEASPAFSHIDLSSELELALAKAWMRVGEANNCVLHHGPESCIAPISPAGQHSDPSGSRMALGYAARVLQRSAGNFEARWLLNIAAMTLGDWPDRMTQEFVVPASAFRSEQPTGRFTEVAARAGFTGRGLYGGLAVDDFDGDGFLDVLMSQWTLARPMSFYRNTGEGRFVDESQSSGIAELTGGSSLIHGDVDNDGDLDVIVVRGGWVGTGAPGYPLSLLRNEGGAAFVDATEEAGLLVSVSSPAAAFGDHDGDGWLDLFVCSESAGAAGQPCLLFRSNRDGTFSDVALTVGIVSRGLVKGCAWGDLDDDGDLDLAVTRMRDRDLLFRNDGGRFTEVGEAFGVTGMGASLGCWWFDGNNDGHLDLFTAACGFDQVEAVCRDYLGLLSDGVTPRLYLNRGNGPFDDATTAQGLKRVLPTMGGNTGDFDNDGWPDLYLGTGDPGGSGQFPNRALRNDGGRRFADVTTAAGLGHLQTGGPLAFADFDNDGDQDIFEVMGGLVEGDSFPRVLFENSGSSAGWVTLLLEGVRSNRSAIGARVRARVFQPDGSVRDIHHLVGTGGSMGSQSLQAELGLGNAISIQEVEVRWPGSGTVQVFKDLPMRRFWKLIEGHAEPIPLERKAFKLGAEEP